VIDHLAGGEARDLRRDLEELRAAVGPEEHESTSYNADDRRSRSPKGPR
jgi:hypothetical protein